MKTRKNNNERLLGFISKELGRLIFLFCAALFIMPSPIAAAEFGPPPGIPESTSIFQIPGLTEERGLELALVTGGFSVNTQNREESRMLYNNTYLASEGIAMNWTGNHAACSAGSTAQDFRDAILLRVNYFRAMGGAPADVTFSAEFNGKNQDGALMMSANSALSHSPPMSWTCYSADGAEAAENSNIALGVSAWDAITGYMRDSGSNNSAVGHRRWILYPQTQTMGTGDVPAANGFLAANTLWVFDSNIFGPRPTTREDFVAWPPPGYVPFQVVFARWSFSYDEADFKGVSVFMESNGVNVPVALAVEETGFGENTIVWRPNNMDDADNWPQPAEDTTYTVTISNVLINGSPQTITYDVTVFDPAIAGPATEYTGIQITGLSSNIMGTVMAGDTVTFTATALTAMGVGPVTYRFFTRKGYELIADSTSPWGGNRWQLRQNWSGMNSASIPFTEPGFYFMAVHFSEDTTWSAAAGGPQIGMVVEVWAVE